jgi:hypothetical protein
MTPAEAMAVGDVVDLMAEDQRVIQAIELAVVGLGAGHGIADESAGVRTLLRHLDQRLAERKAQLLALLKEAPAIGRA